MSYTVRLDVGVYFSPPSPLSPFQIKFQNFFPTFSRALIVEPSPIISKLIALMEAIESIEMNSRLTEFSRIQITRFTEFPRVLSFARARNIEHAGKCRCRVFAFPFSGGGQGAPLSFACLPVLIVFLNCDHRWRRIFFFCFTQGKIIIRIYWMESLIWIMALDDTPSSGKSLRGKKLYLRFPLSK